MNLEYSSDVQAKLPPELSINFDAHCARLENYVSKMKPGQIIDSAQTGVQNQMELWTIIKLMLDRPAQEFNAHYTEMLRVIRENIKGAFGPRYLYRFFESLRMSSDDRRIFENLLHLMTVTCDPGTRMLSMRQVDMITVLSRLKNEDHRQKVAGFYEI